MRLVQYVCAAATGCLALLSSPAVAAAPCANPDALGTSRVLVVDPAAHPRVGTMQYHETLPLADHEVVLTFDDGPLHPYTDRILDILASQCVKATYFLVGQMAQAYPKSVQRIYQEGHTIGTHSEHHPLTFNKMDRAQIEKEVDGGIASVKAALGGDKPIAPFFRIPGLLRSATTDEFLESHGLMTWSADFLADDWKRISDKEIVKRALTRLEVHNKGILLLHDIHPATALALPVLLHELKLRGYHIVQVVPATPERPATPSLPEQWFMHRPPAPPLEMLLDVSAVGVIPGLPVSAEVATGDHPFAKSLVIPITVRAAKEQALHRRKRGHATPAGGTLWPASIGAVNEIAPGGVSMPSPGPQLFQAPLVSAPAIRAQPFHEATAAHADLSQDRLPQDHLAQGHLAQDPGRAAPLPPARPETPQATPAAMSKPQAASGTDALGALITRLWHRP